MANNLKVFNNYNDYETADLIKPAVSLVVSDNSVHYDPIEPTPPPTFDGKWKAIYSDSSTSSAECGAISAITQNEITLTNLVAVEIGDCVTSIGGGAFQSCSSLTSCTIGSGVTSIGNSAFNGCSGLTSIVIPNSVTSIGNEVFQNCTSLTSIDIPSGVTTIGYYAFSYCTSLTSIDIPNGVTSIGSNAFRNCSGLASITIPYNVTNIGSQALYGCTSLTSITIEATTPPTLGLGALIITNDCPIYVPAESVSTYQSASGWSDYASRILAIP